MREGIWKLWSIETFKSPETQPPETKGSSGVPVGSRNYYIKYFRDRRKKGIYLYRYFIKTEN
jgi:hypothetical protein